MKKQRTRARAGIGPLAAGIALGGAILFWALPAFLINLDWTPKGSIAWNLAAALSIVATALIFERIRHMPRGWTWIGLACLGAFLITLNVANGFRNAVTRSGDASDHRRGEIETALRAKDMRDRLTAGRLEAVAIAREVPASQYRAAFEQRKAADARRWRATAGCNPGRITLPESEAYCADIAALLGKLEAAQRRDHIDGQLVALDIRREQAAPTPASADPFADAAAGALGAVGLALSPQTVARIFDALWALVPELLAALMPAITLGLFDRPQLPQQNPVKTRATRNQTANDDATLPEPAEQDPFSRFVADMLEAAPGERLSPADAYRAWQTWCATHDRKPESQRWLGLRLGQVFSCDDRHKRKFYLGVRVRRQTQLRLVSAA